MICSDHKPLIYLFGEHRGISMTASAQVQRWTLTFMGYHYTIVHHPGRNMGNADSLSRLPVPTKMKDPPQPYDTILLMERLNSSLVTAAHIRACIDKDPCLSKLRKMMHQGWMEAEEDEQVKPYMNRRGELSVEDGCILCGTRVLISPQLRSKVLDEIHKGHPGIC